ncbi:(2Fe-2S) ferredoxin domain-containing protein [Thalassospira sp. MA62]|nr:(2Fe-2S) ferredoxin domain-containing protein [Thalassospira sp. MA62]
MDNHALSVMDPDIPKVFKRHVFGCMTQRPEGHPRGSCGAVGAKPLWDRLCARVEAEGLAAEIGTTVSGCLGFCSAGPVMVIYPEGIWYRPKSPEDIDEIIESHLKQGIVVERLAMVFARN